MTFPNSTRIYYTGDMANSSGHFEVTSNVRGQVTLKEIDGDRKFTVYASQIGEEYFGHCNPRFVTETARQAWRAHCAATR